MRRGYGALFFVYVLISPIVLALCLLRYLWLAVRYLYRAAYGNRRALHKRAERAIEDYRDAPQRARQESARREALSAARREADQAMRRGDVRALQAAWREIDRNGGDYQ
jgi:hypothetical protein